MRKIIAVVGDGKIERNGKKYQLAFSLGKALVERGYRVQSGGLGGVMEAVFAGARAAENYREGDTIAIIPSFAREDANAFADIVIPTGMDVMRNAIVANADVVIAIGGGAGTLSEMAIAWSLFRLVIAFDCVEGWSKELAGRRLDARVRYPALDDKIYAVSNVDECLNVLGKYIEEYCRVHRGIKRCAENNV